MPKLEEQAVPNAGLALFYLSPRHFLGGFVKIDPPSPPTPFTVFYCHHLSFTLTLITTHIHNGIQARFLDLGR